MTRIEQIKRAGYRVITLWECEFVEKPELLEHPIIKLAPLITRDAVYGERTESIRLHYKIREGKKTV
jgi:G:T-mismatch repair DNA endonuclease (very short patch repair protein)